MGQNGSFNHPESSENPKALPRLPKSNINLAKQMGGLTNGERPDNELADPVVVDLNGVRLREITSKAIAGILLMLLKWFRLSRT